MAIDPASRAEPDPHFLEWGTDPLSLPKITPMALSYTPGVA